MLQALHWGYAEEANKQPVKFQMQTMNEYPNESFSFSFYGSGVVSGNAYLCKIGGFANSIHPNKNNDIWPPTLLGSVHIPEYVNRAPWGQNPKKSILHSCLQE